MFFSDGCLKPIGFGGDAKTLIYRFAFGKYQCAFNDMTIKPSTYTSRNHDLLYEKDVALRK